MPKRIDVPPGSPESVVAEWIATASREHLEQALTWVRVNHLEIAARAADYANRYTIPETAEEGEDA